MVYQQCGPLCPQICDNLDQPCEGGCTEGCFCPVGQVLLDGECVEPLRCTGIFHTKTCRILQYNYKTENYDSTIKTSFANNVAIIISIKEKNSFYLSTT